MCRKLLGITIGLSVTLVTVFLLLAHFLYKTKTEGVIYLQNASGEAEILRESETHIPHIYASSENMAIYTQGFLHAQERMWLMERLRRVSQGRLSEILGEKTISIDKFFRTLGLGRAAEDSLVNMDAKSLEILENYSNGINDYLSNVNLFKEGASAKLLPPEFYLLNHTNIEPWTPKDSVSIFKLLNFHLSWNWSQDLLRDYLVTIDLGDMVDEIFPFTAEFASDMVTIMNEEDIIGTKFWSQETLLDRYHKESGKQPKLTPEKLKKLETVKQKEAKELKEKEAKRLAEEAVAKKQAEQELQAKKDQEAKEKAEKEAKAKKEQEAKRQTESKAKAEQEEKKKKDQEAEALKQKAQEDKKLKAKEEKERKKKELEEKEQARLKQEKEEKDIKLKNEQIVKEAQDNQEETETQQIKKESPDSTKEDSTKYSSTESKEEQIEQKEPSAQKIDETKPAKQTQATKEEQKSTTSKDREPAKNEPETLPEQMDQQIYLDEPQASNNWVIHGNHTKNGMPLLAGDPHLSNQIPSHWYLMALHYDDQYLIGSSHPGLPYVMYGKSKNMAWAVTACLVDLSDLFKEKLSEDGTKYFVDGEWRQLKIAKEKIWVKGQEEPIELDVKITHRGPIVSNKLLTESEVLFSEGLPSFPTNDHYSLAWTGHVAQENTIPLIRSLIETTSVSQLFKEMDEIEFHSVPQNLVVAYNNGDIGYFLGASMPNRKNNKPYVGCRIIDGTSSEYDWIGYMKTSDLPRVANPKKGYIVTANNRQVPENFITDIGATITTTTRSRRITELIQLGIDKNHKFDLKDMITIQNDTVDILARDMVPLVTKISNSMLEQLTPQQRQDALVVLNKLSHWHGEYEENSIGATIYSVWEYKFFTTFLGEYLTDNKTRLQMTANYPFLSFAKRLIQTIAEDPEYSDFNKVCKNAFGSDYKGSKQCAYNMARSMAETYRFLHDEVSPNVIDWEWKNVHFNEYPNMPWSLSPLKPLFHREVATGGNGNTIRVSKYSLKKLDQTKRFKSFHTPNYKQVISFAKDPHESQMYYSMDTGQSGNLLSGHYFDYNAAHLNGDLKRAIIGKENVQQVQHTKLTIKPEALRVEEIRTREEHMHEHRHDEHDHDHHHDHSHHHHSHSHKSQRREQVEKDEI